MSITATQLADFLTCPHRVFLDEHGDYALRAEPNAFVEMLWSQGIKHEDEMLRKVGVTCDLSQVPFYSRNTETLAAMDRKEAVIYQGLLQKGDDVGIPDLLLWTGCGYRPVDIKSGNGIELDGDDDAGKLKKPYAVQVAHYVDILERLERSDGTRGAAILDRRGEMTPYPLMQAQGARTPETWMDAYHDTHSKVAKVIHLEVATRPAMASICKLCPWESGCRQQLIAEQDLTLVAELGRAKRDVLAQEFPNLQKLAACDPSDYIAGKKTNFKGVGPDTLRKYHARAKLLVTPDSSAYLKAALDLPVMEREVFFDVEDDPLHDNFLYLSGFLEREHGLPGTSRYLPKFAWSRDAAAEMQAFSETWAYLQERVKDSTIWYYSKYERTTLKRMANRYPSVCSEDDVMAFFANPNVVDLYFDVVKPFCEFPTYSQSIKELAKYFGFSWRAKNPSGAASIEWFNRWCETGDEAIKQALLEYNEDDNIAAAVVLDGVRGLQVATAA